MHASLRFLVCVFMRSWLSTLTIACTATTQVTYNIKAIQIQFHDTQHESKCKPVFYALLGSILFTGRLSVNRTHTNAVLYSFSTPTATCTVTCMLTENPHRKKKSTLGSPVLPTLHLLFSLQQIEVAWQQHLQRHPM